MIVLYQKGRCNDKNCKKQHICCLDGQAHPLMDCRDWISFLKYKERVNSRGKGGNGGQGRNGGQKRRRQGDYNFSNQNFGNNGNFNNNNNNNNNSNESRGFSIQDVASLVSALGATEEGKKILIKPRGK